MGEFDKNQDEGTQTGEQGEKPAFGQFDNEKGQGQQDQGQDKQPQDETADTAEPSGDEKGTPGQQS